MLRKLRIALSVSFTVLLTVYLIDFTGTLPQVFKELARWQVIPALLSLNLLVIIVLTLLTFITGRLYCSTLCPLGFFQDVVSRVASFVQKKKRFRYQKSLNWLRWLVVVACVVAFTTGFTFLVGFFDPYSIFMRMSVHMLKPVYLAGNNLMELIFSNFGNHTFYKMSIYLLSGFSLGVALFGFLVIGLMAWRNGRIYCNTICPVGTALGLAGKAAFVKIRIDESKCNSCGACGRRCKSSCIDTKTHFIDYSRCVVCFDCIDVCSQSAIRFTAKKSKISVQTPVDNSKRTFLFALGATSLAAGKLIASSSVAPFSTKNKAKRQVPISPPGSTGHDNLLSKCTSCHLCVSKCPTGIIKPAFTEYGAGGVMQPMLNFEHGFCNYDCSICSDVCPTGALLPLNKEHKHELQIGQVHFVSENCIVVTDGTHCGACSEHCPTQAVSMVPYKNGLDIPFTRTEICVGCGGCEYVCPATPHKAIYVEGIAKHQKIVLEKAEKKEIEVNDFGF